MQPSVLRRTLAISVLTVAAMMACVAPAPAQTAKPRVIGGSNVPITQVPFQVRLVVGPYGCGGSIRDATHVITAAHCVTTDGSVHVKMSPTTMTVFYGSAKQSRQASVGVSAVAVPSQYTALVNADESYDAAILTLSRPLNLSGPNAKAIPIASTAQPKTSGNAFVSGWGETQDNNPSSTPDDLRGVTVPLQPDSACRSVYGGAYVSTRAVCAGGGSQAAGTNPDTCQGDSGGPLAATSGGRYVLLGVTSFGNACGARTPAVYTYTRGDGGLGSFITTGASLDAGPTRRVNTPAAPLDLAKPKARVSKVRCKHGRCTIRLRASDRGGKVKKLSVRIRGKVRKCRAAGFGVTCKTVRTRTKKPRAKKVAGGYRVRIKLKPGRYSLTAVATDTSGNRSKTARKRFRVRR